MNDFPYTNFHELNQDWIIKQTGENTNNINTLSGDVEQEKRDIEALRREIHDISSLYFCTFNVTTNAQIIAAINNNMLPVCIYNNILYVLSENSSATRQRFGAVYRNTTYNLECLYDAWLSYTETFATQTYVDTAIAAIPDELYLCTYDSTTNAEIETALAAGQLPICYNNGDMFIYCSKGGTTAHYFTSLFVSYTGHDALVSEIYCRSNVWGIKTEQYAPKNNPTFTGTPKAPTAATGTDTTQIASTEFVQQELNPVRVSDSLKAIDIASHNRLDYTTGTLGIITKTGAIVADNDWKISNYIPVTPGETLYEMETSAANFALFDEDLNIVSNSNNWTNPFTIPANVKYIKVTYLVANETQAYISDINSYDVYTKIVPYIQNAVEETLDIYTNGNMIDTTVLINGFYVNGAVDGKLKTASGFSVTDFIPVKPNTQYYSNQNYVFRGYAAFYDSSKTYISGYGNGAGLFWNNPVTSPNNAAYARFTIINANIPNAWISENNRMTTKPENYSYCINRRNEFISNNPTEYTGNEINVFTKILCIGDSLTEGFFNETNGSRLVMTNRAFPKKLEELTGIECVNLGESGFTSEDWYTAHASDNLSGYDACIIQLGVNDQLQNVSENDMDTALSNIITKVETENTDIKIFVATIIPANGYMTSAMKNRANMIRNFVSNLNDSNVYLVDLWTYGNTDNYLAYDAGHLSALGYLKLAEDYKAYISYIIKTHMNEFRYVQFIGTAYTYSGDTTIREITYS